jgi:hypothetical protein
MCPDGNPDSPPLAPAAQNASHPRAPAGRTNQPPRTRVAVLTPATTAFAPISAPSSQSHQVSRVAAHATAGPTNAPRKDSDTASAAAAVIPNEDGEF